MTEQSATRAYADLQPDDILEALDDLGFRCDGRFLALNSYENRVYRVGIEDDRPVVAKFYRPARWSDDEILEEHAFTHELAAAEIPVVAPLIIDAAGLEIPEECPGIPTDLLTPRNTWDDKAAYDAKAAKLAGGFRKNFDDFAEQAGAEIAAAGPVI